jgi:hypothetical protein
MKRSDWMKDQKQLPLLRLGFKEIQKTHPVPAIKEIRVLGELFGTKRL